MTMVRRILHEIYLIGYSGRTLPRWMRRKIARTELHRAWLVGYLGWFTEDGIKYGPAKPYGRSIMRKVIDRR